MEHRGPHTKAQQLFYSDLGSLFKLMVSKHQELDMLRERGEKRIGIWHQEIRTFREAETTLIARLDQALTQGGGTDDICQELIELSEVVQGLCQGYDKIRTRMHDTLLRFRRQFAELVEAEVGMRNEAREKQLDALRTIGYWPQKGSGHRSVYESAANDMNSLEETLTALGHEIDDARVMFARIDRAVEQAKLKSAASESSS
ncbi:MAG: hypothetical protein M1833_003402 [Piccolia ochrophora]|nr:MAG: hypothetical protein M1833_003402 [Piccolia ochrophora]